MYIPKSFAETDIHRLHDLIRNYNFAVLFAAGIATHLPFMIDPERGEYGTLIAHFARANSHWKHLSPDEDVLVVFQGAHSYISPRWYPSGSITPTWSYAAVHAYGKPQLIHEPAAIKSMLKALLEVQEGPDFVREIEDRFPDNRLPAIVGIEIPIERIEGKFKYGQNKSLEDQQGVIAALEGTINPDQQVILQYMKQRLTEKTAP